MSTLADVQALSYIRAVNLALEHALATDPSVIVLGEDVALPNGPFGATKGLHAAFGDRVIDTPISESAMVGTALGAAMGGLRPVLEVIYADFLLVAMDQIVNQVANARYVSRSALTAPLVIRTQQGHTPGACAQHSQSLEALFAHVPGLRVGVPSTPRDAYSMLRLAIESEDPVMIFESRRLYPTKGDVAPGEADAGLGVSETVRRGSELTVVTWGTGRALVEESLADAAAPSVDLIDLRWLSPWDSGAVIESVGRTGRLLVVHEANETGGFGAEVVSTVSSALGSGLRASGRVGLRGTPVPAAPPLAQAVLPTVSRVSEAMSALMEV
ncbi:MAG: acetoin dehydrogenase [Frankiales bacterium]|nr:acetoin dehydrogenase [Frankiales bacterium]